MIVIGDHYFFNGTLNTGTQTAVCRKTNINSDNEFNIFQKENPEFTGSISQSEYLNAMTCYGLFHVMPVLAKSDIKCQLKMASDIELQMLQDKNFIFIGSFKTLGTLKKMVENLGIIYDIHEKHQFKKDGKFELQEFNSKFASSDFTSIIKFTTPKGSEILFIIAGKDFGNIGLIKNITNFKTLKEIETKLPKNNFRASFRITGEGKTDFSTKLIVKDKIKEEIIGIWP
jgi:hypothetical protein